MLRFVIFSSVLSVALVSSNAILDLNCVTSATAGYASNAFACENNQADIACLQAYPSPDDYVTSEGNAEDRPFQCYTNGTDYDAAAVIIPAIIDMAVASCAKQCGYCCLTDEFQCDNARFPRINCNTVTQKMCKDPKWREIIAQDCPSTCGFCLLGGCIDSAPDCETQPSICVTRGMEDFIANNCQRTCELCSSSTTAAGSVTSGTGGCTNANANCASWVRNGFCTNNFYTSAQRAAHCASSCGLC